MKPAVLLTVVLALIIVLTIDILHTVDCVVNEAGKSNNKIATNLKASAANGVIVVANKGKNSEASGKGKASKTGASQKKKKHLTSHLKKMGHKKLIQQQQKGKGDKPLIKNEHRQKQHISMSKNVAAAAAVSRVDGKGDNNNNKYMDMDEHRQCYCRECCNDKNAGKNGDVVGIGNNSPVAGLTKGKQLLSLLLENEAAAAGKKNRKNDNSSSRIKRMVNKICPNCQAHYDVDDDDFTCADCPDYALQYAEEETESSDDESSGSGGSSGSSAESDSDPCAADNADLSSVTCPDCTSKDGCEAVDGCAWDAEQYPPCSANAPDTPQSSKADSNDTDDQQPAGGYGSSSAESNYGSDNSEW